MTSIVPTYLIFMLLPKHILSIPDIDKRLKNGDLTLVDEIATSKLEKKRSSISSTRLHQNIAAIINH